MRSVLALLAAASVLVGCGGDDDAPQAGGERAVVRSDDGRAELTLPPGVNAEGISVEAIEVEDAAVAYELRPSGTTFDEPAILSIDDVVAPAPGAIAFAVLDDDDGEVELAETEAVHTAGDEHATVMVTIPHFSSAAVFWRGSGGEQRYFGSASFYVPSEVALEQPFATDVEWRELSRTMYFGAELEVEIKQVRLRGRFTADNASPSVVDDAPPLGPATGGVIRQQTFRCRQPGPIRLAYFAFVELDYVRRAAGRETSGTLKSRSRYTSNISCVSRATTSQSSTTGTWPNELPPTVSEIRVDLQVPVTTWTVSASVAPGDDSKLSYLWKIVGESCGTPKTPFERSRQTVSWSHADSPPDSCAHASPSHDVTASVQVFTANGSVQCIVHGTESQVIRNPVCSPT